MCTIHTSSQSLQTPLPHRILTIFLLSLGRSRLSATPLSLHNSITSIQAHNVTPPSFNVTKAYSVPASGVGNKSDPQIFQNDYSSNYRRTNRHVAIWVVVMMSDLFVIPCVHPNQNSCWWSDIGPVSLGSLGPAWTICHDIIKIFRKHVEPHAAARLNTFVSG